MILKYMTGSAIGLIVRRKFTRQSGKHLYYRKQNGDEDRVPIRGRWQSYFDTFDEARAHLIKQSDKRRRKAAVELEAANDEHLRLLKLEEES